MSKQAPVDMKGPLEWARDVEVSVVVIFGCWLDEIYLETVVGRNIS